MISAKEVQGVMAMMLAFSTRDADDPEATASIDAANLQSGVDRIIRDGVDIVATTGSFGECYNLFWDEYKTLAAATVEAVKKRVPVFIGATSPNPLGVVQRLKLVQELVADLLGGSGGGARPAGADMSAGKLTLEFAGYCNPGPTRTSVLKFSQAVIDRARKKAEHWKSLCEKYRPLVEGEAAKTRVAS